ncbi:MAG: hypothetical protein LBQ74_03765 [Prevotella sp.]|jgi:hypothetical protein|nr:hypothetical protein [Prevotella sp.]
MNSLKEILEKLETIEYNQVVLYRKMIELEHALNGTDPERTDNIYYAGELFSASDKAETDYKVFLEGVDNI